MNLKKITYQVIFWIAFFLYNLFDELKYSDIQQSILDSTLATVLIGVLVYLNILWLLPNFFYKKKYFLYIFIVTVSFILLVLISSVFSGTFLSDYYILFADLLMVGGISSVWIMLEQIRTKEKLTEIKKEQINTNLKFLKAQINPHFLFNVLNNINFLIASKPQKASETLVKLSDLLRYQLYDTDMEQVAIENEIKHIRSYIELEKIRIGDKLDLDLNINYTNDNISIEPFLLLPLIDNAFKHSTSLEKRFVSLNLTISDKIIELKTINSFTEVNNINKDKGIGLINLKQRLNLLYPQKYSLNNRVDGDKYVTHLKIFLI